MTMSDGAWWRAVSPYLDQALDMPADDRVEWLRSMRERDPAAASMMEALLAQHELLARERFLEQSPPAVDPEDSRAGTPVGAYTLVRPIGEGGMGTVWLAERSDGEIQHRVAVKFLAPGGQRPVWRERFLRERQMLASLSHPSIVHVIDAGHTAQGRPYLVMEYVDGLPIDVYAADLPVPERLRLFLRVCEGVAHAHQHLIIHRDLKPTNILVDASGQPKLLDFGIAKLVDETASVTQTVERLLTPQYASPEQLRGTPQSTATDIYSLGAVLYKLLTGRAPHEGQRRTAATDTQELVPASRVNPAVPADADYVVRRALRDDPAHRYSSVEALAADVRALLESRPVAARAGDRWYRLRMFVRRNRVPIGAAAMVMVSLSGGLYAANRQRAIADDRFQQVRQLANRFIALDAELRLIEGTTDIRSRIVVDALQYLEALGRDAARDPGLSLEIATAYQQVARVQGVPFISNLGLMPQAEESLRKANTFIDAVLAREPRNRQALLTSAQIAHDRMAVVDMQNRRDDALAAARSAANRLDQFFDGYTATADDVNAATQIYSNIAIAYQNSNRFEESIRYSRRALDISAGVEAARMRRASAFGVLAYSLRRVGDLDGALTAGQESRLLLEHLAPADRGNLINALWRVGLTLGEDGGPNLGRPDDALRAFQQGLDIAEEQASKDPTDSRSRVRVGVVALEIGNILRHSDPARARAVYDRALARLREIDANVRSRDGEIALLTMSSYAARALGREADARARLAESFKLLRAAKAYPVDAIEPQSGADNALRALAAQHEAAGELARAAEIYQELITKSEALPIRPAEDLRDAAFLSNTWTARARLLRRLGKTAEAESLETRRTALWTAWAQRRPHNVFVRAQLENAGRP